MGGVATDQESFDALFNCPEGTEHGIDFSQKTLVLRSRNVTEQPSSFVLEAIATSDSSTVLFYAAAGSCGGGAYQEPIFGYTRLLIDRPSQEVAFEDCWFGEGCDGPIPE